MNRRLPRLAAVAAGAVLLLGACGPAAPALTDPNDIFDQSLTATAAGGSFHLVATVSGSIKLDLLGSGSAQPMSLSGTSATVDVDQSAGKAKIAFVAPAGLLGLTGTLIAIDDALYVQTSLSGPKYFKIEGSSAVPDLPVDIGSLDTTGGIAKLKDALAKAGINPTKLDDVDCPSGRCYQLRLVADSSTLSGLPGASDLPDLGSGSLTLTLLIDQSTLRLTTLGVVAEAGAEGSVTLNLAFSDWGETPSIEAPPADQVTEGNPFDLFGGF